MKNVLIIGANGYIGARLSKYLSDEGYDVTALCYPSVPKNVEWINSLKRVTVGDIREEAVINELASYPVDVIIHLVSLDHNQCKDYLFNDVLSINVNPVGNLLDKFSKKGLKKFIYFSTFQVYGKVDNNLITEDYRTAPLNLYGLTHLLSEQIVSYYNSITGTDCVSVRLSNSYGSPLFDDNNCWWLVINELCRNAYMEGKIQLKSDGFPQRDFIHSSDLCRAVKLLIEVPKIQNSIFNLASGNTFSILELAFEVRKTYINRFNRDMDIYLPNNIIPDYSQMFTNRKQFIVDNSKLKSLGFIPQFKLSEGIDELFNYLMQNGK